jgi:hypothetical protein
MLREPTTCASAIATKTKYPTSAAHNDPRRTPPQPASEPPEPAGAQAQSSARRIATAA